MTLEEFQKRYGKGLEAGESIALEEPIELPGGQYILVKRRADPQRARCVMGIAQNNWHSYRKERDLSRKKFFLNEYRENLERLEAMGEIIVDDLRMFSDFDFCYPLLPSLYSEAGE